MGNADSDADPSFNSRPHSPGSPAPSTYLFTPQMENENTKEDNPSRVDAYTTSSTARPDGGYPSTNSGQRSPSPTLFVPQETMQRFLESVNWYWKETWKLKDYKDIKDDRESSIDISFGKDKEAPSVRPYPMVNWKSSIDIMYNRNSSHLFEPHGSFVASLSVPKYSAVRANYSYEYPEDNSHEVEIEYSRLEHWILKMKLPLNQSPERTFKFSAISRWDAFSFPFEITMKDSENYKVANWSVGLTREAPTFSFLFKISQLKAGEQIESSATASYKVKSPHLSASTSWEKNKIKCSFQHKDGDLLYTSEGHLNFIEPEKSLCSVALRKKIDESKGIQVAFDTNNTTTIEFSYCVATKFKFKVCAKVYAGDINHTQINASFTYQ